LEDAATPCEEPRAELSYTRRERLNEAEDKIGVEVVEAVKEIDNIPELNEEATTIQQDQTPLAVEETNEQIVAKPDLEKTATLVAEDINIEDKLDAEEEEPFTSMLPPSAVEDDPVNQRTMVSCTDEQQGRLVYVLIEVS
jgi:hypothetical protein